MFFNNILEELTDILVYYYSVCRNKIVSDKTKSFLNYQLRQRIAEYRYHDDEISDIDVSFGVLDTLNVDILDNIAVYRIKQYIISNIQDTSIRVREFDDFNISLNVCPFEGLTINGQFVISVCDCMMY